MIDLLLEFQGKVIFINSRMQRTIENQPLSKMILRITLMKEINFMSLKINENFLIYFK